MRPALAIRLRARGGLVHAAAAHPADRDGQRATGGGAWNSITIQNDRCRLAQLHSAVCRSIAGNACTPVVYRSALYELRVALVAVLLTLAAVVALWRYSRRTKRARTRSRAHARAALLAGRPLPGTGAVVLDDPRPAAYCVQGRPAAIVLTSGALAVLDNAQLAAVLAHERAHLCGRHHAAVLVTRGLAAAFPGVPLFTRGAAEVARLAEMSADDAAARRTGRTTLVAALLSIGTGIAVPAATLGLAAAGYSVPVRVERMLQPARPVRGAFCGLALAVLAATAAVMPAVLAALTG
jgi:Zn-dependent protease with chaperone function